MLLEFLPTLEVHRELYSMPRGMERFRAYIARMTGHTGDIALPIVAMNPMGKEPMIRAVEAWIACGAEEAAAEAVREAAERFALVSGWLRVALVLALTAGCRTTGEAPPSPKAVPAPSRLVAVLESSTAAPGHSASRAGSRSASKCSSRGSGS